MTNLTVDPQTDPLVSSETVTVNETSHNLSKSILIEILIFILLTATAYGAYWYTKNYLVLPPSQPPVSNVPTETSQPKKLFLKSHQRGNSSHHRRDGQLENSKNSTRFGA